MLTPISVTLICIAQAHWAGFSLFSCYYVSRKDSKGLLCSVGLLVCAVVPILSFNPISNMSIFLSKHAVLAEGRLLWSRFQSRIARLTFVRLSLKLSKLLVFTSSS